jgi:hypothetical protein
MKTFFSLRRTTLALALLGIVGLAVPLPGAHADTFQANGAYLDTSIKQNTTEGTVAGAATPSGAFVGDYKHKKSDDLTQADGRATLDFGNGDTLTIDYVLVYNPATGLLQGSYVIHRGTGALKQATGGGDIAVTEPVHQEGLFWLNGELFLT